MVPSHVEHKLIFFPLFIDILDLLANSFEERVHFLNVPHIISERLPIPILLGQGLETDIPMIFDLLKFVDLLEGLKDSRITDELRAELDSGIGLAFIHGGSNVGQFFDDSSIHTNIT